MDKKEYQRDWYKKHPENRRKSQKKYKLSEKGKKKRIEYLKKTKEHRLRHCKDYHLKVKYGITIEQKEQMIIAQNNRCAICNSVFVNFKAVRVDHNHITNRTRQLLCDDCNLSLGKVKEDISILKNMIIYLEKWDLR